MQDPQRILVTGGAGFIGANLTAALAQRLPDARITVLDDFRTGSFENLVEAFGRHRLGVFEHAIIAEDLASLDINALLGDVRPDLIFHQAAITDTTVAEEREMLRVNTATMRPLLEAAFGERLGLSARVVYASSAATYGTPTQAATRTPFPLDAAGRPNNVYGFSKWLMECEHRRFAAERRGTPWIVGLRYFNVFGPSEARKGKMASIAHQLARQILDGANPRLFEFGEQARDQVHVDDVVGANLAAAGLGERPDPAPGVYNCGSGRTTTFAEVADAVRLGLGVSEAERPTEYFPMPASIAAFYQDYTCADLAETARGLGWRPARTPKDAIAEYAAWIGASRAPAGAPS